MRSSDYCPNSRYHPLIKFRKADVGSNNMTWSVFFRDEFVGYCTCCSGLWMMFIPGFSHPIKAFSRYQSRIELVEQYLVLFA